MYIKSKLIKNYCVSGASVHDYQVLDKLLNESDKDKELYADSTYVGQDDMLEKYEVISKVNEKCYRKKLLN